MAEIIKIDGIEMWLNPLNEIIKWMQNEDLSIMETGMELFCNLLNVLGKELNPLIPALMPSMFCIFTFPEVKKLNFFLKF